MATSQCTASLIKIVTNDSVNVLFYIHLAVLKCGCALILMLKTYFYGDGFSNYLQYLHFKISQAIDKSQCRLLIIRDKI